MRNCITFLFVFGFISLLSQKEYMYADIEKKAAFIEVLNIWARFLYAPLLSNSSKPIIEEFKNMLLGSVSSI